MCVLHTYKPDRYQKALSSTKNLQGSYYIQKIFTLEIKSNNKNELHTHRFRGQNGLHTRLLTNYIQF